jgi:uroporphyrinogen III methyltransferase/synthase
MAKRVCIVGAGPGDPGLLTRHAWETLQQAEVIVYDRLVGEAVVSLFPPEAECIDVGKAPGNHPVPQEAICELLKKKAQEGKRVVRLKGGDPFIFGRGGEEALFLLQEGIEVEVIPGMSAALAVPALAGIPLTHRGMSSGFLVISGHDLSHLDWELLVRFSGTLVVLMAAKNLGVLVGELLRRGKPADLPAAVIMEGTTARQRTVLGHLGDIAEKTETEGLQNPLVLVVGEVVTLSTQLNFRERRPLFGKRLLFTGTTAETFTFPTLTDLGVEVLRYPTVCIDFVAESLKEAYHLLPESQLIILSSKNAVKAFQELISGYRLDLRKLQAVKIAVVGRKTAQALAAMGLFPDYCPSSFTTSALLEMLPEGDGTRALILTSQIGGEELIRGLEGKGYLVRKIAAYRSLPNWGIKDRMEKVLQRGVDAAVFTSPSSFRYLEAMFPQVDSFFQETAVLAIGPSTADYIGKRGLPVMDLPEEHTLEGIEKLLRERWVGA